MTTADSDVVRLDDAIDSQKLPGARLSEKTLPGSIG
jgi:hypothetical protein